MSEPFRMYDFVVLGQPIGKGRPKFARKGKFVTAYTPAKTRKEEARIKKIFETAYPGHTPTKGAVIIRVKALMQIPKSATKKFREKCTKYLYPCLTKPDADNILKLVIDALNGVAFRDDNQICRAEVQKHYAAEPKIHVELILFEGGNE